MWISVYVNVSECLCILSKKYNIVVCALKFLWIRCTEFRGCKYFCVYKFEVLYYKKGSV